VSLIPRLLWHGGWSVSLIPRLLWHRVQANPSVIIAVREWDSLTNIQLTVLILFQSVYCSYVKVCTYCVWVYAKVCMDVFNSAISPIQLLLPNFINVISMCTSHTHTAPSPHKFWGCHSPTDSCLWTNTWGTCETVCMCAMKMGERKRSSSDEGAWRGFPVVQYRVLGNIC